MQLNSSESKNPSSHSQKGIFFRFISQVIQVSIFYSQDLHFSEHLMHYFKSSKYPSEHLQFGGLILNVLHTVQ